MFSITRKITLAAALLLAIAVAAASGAKTAHAYTVCTTAKTAWVISDARWMQQPTNVYSDYIRGPGTISYTKSKTAATGAALSAEVTAEAGVVLAKASTTVGTTVSKTWSHDQSWSYTKPVPAGRVARLMMFHQALQFRASKYRLGLGGCTRAELLSTSVNVAPVAGNANLWDLQYR